MNSQRIQTAKKIIRQNFCFYAAGLLLILGMKYFYSNAESDHLIWILAPIAKWVELLSGIAFEYAPGAGYANHSLRLLIAPTCSGVQFMIITFTLFLFSFVHRITPSAHTSHANSIFLRYVKGFCWLIISMILSYLLTIFVNGLRIITAIYLPALLGEEIYRGFLTPDRLHTMIGIVVYFTALLAIYRVTDFFFSKSKHSGNGRKSNAYLPQLVRRCLPPVFWYFGIALGVPFVNNAYSKNTEKFTELTILIICCCLVILMLYGLLFAVRKLFRKLQ